MLHSQRTSARSGHPSNRTTAPPSTIENDADKNPSANYRITHLHAVSSTQNSVLYDNLLLLHLHIILARTKHAIVTTNSREKQKKKEKETSSRTSKSAGESSHGYLMDVSRPSHELSIVALLLAFFLLFFISSASFPSQSFSAPSPPLPGRRRPLPPLNLPLSVGASPVAPSACSRVRPPHLFHLLLRHRPLSFRVGGSSSSPIFPSKDVAGTPTTK